MTTIEAFELLAAKYPQANEIKVWDWIVRRTARDQVRHNLSVELEGRTWDGATLEEAIGKVKLPSRRELADGKRQAAADLLAQAEKLEAVETPATPEKASV